MNNKIIYTKDQSDLENISLHLQEVDETFVPPLHSYINIKEYSEKIFVKARKFEAWENGALCGLIAAYFNTDQKSVYITNVSILPQKQGFGIAGNLLDNLMKEAFSFGIKIVHLEVYKKNTKAKEFYLKKGFSLTEETSETVILSKEI